MRILLAHNSLYYPSHGGGDKSNRLLMEALAKRGHDVSVVARVERFGPEDHARLLRDLQTRGVVASTNSDGAVRFDRKGVQVHAVALQPGFRAYFSQQIASFDPDVILTSTDDPGQLLFDPAIRAPRAHVVHLVRATIAVPFGPDSSAPNAAKTELLKRADAVVGVSQYVARYVREHGGLEAVHVPISLLDPVEEYPELGSFENPYVSMANPCAVKGIGIFVELAARMPHVQFAAFPTWGTTPADLDSLRARSNIAVLPPVDDIDDLLRVTKVLLVPSVWAEARSRIVPEAMSRGVPVVSSNAGGLPEAHLGVDYMLPVNVITRYKPGVDISMVPVPEVPPQEIAPWQAAVERLTSDRRHWAEIARQSRDAALDYARNLNVLPFETLLQQVLQRPKKPAPAPALSEEKRKLLALRLKQKAGPKPQSDAWFSGIDQASAEQPLLFCFPFAGGGTLPYRNWEANVVAVRLPGRETRIDEPPFEDMDVLVSALGEAIEPHTRARRFAFFGHSMGAGIAFELTRWLRRKGATLPELLVVSSARAPQWRLNLQPAPDPTDEELIAQLRRLEGLPVEVLANPDLLKLALPALRADTRLYRRYTFHEEPPLPVNILACLGQEDPALRRTDMVPWQHLTDRKFDLSIFPGGHFYIHTSAAPLLEAIRSRLGLMHSM
jgi:surfactin synthase thioesterase subunit/glycosyltransferase involved in cell wall biosynthesis